MQCDRQLGASRADINNYILSPKQFMSVRTFSYIQISNRFHTIKLEIFLEHII